MQIRKHISFSGLLKVLSVACVGWLGLAYCQSRLPFTAVKDMDAITTFVKTNMPGVKIVRYTNRSWGEEEDVWLALEISGKGEVILNNPTMETFTGNGNVRIIELGNCHLGTIRNLSNERWREKHPTIYVSNMVDLVTRWDEVKKALSDVDTPNNGDRPYCST